LERKYPKAVSYANILTVVTRDATLLVGRPFSHKDGKISLASKVNLVLHGHEKIKALTAFFEEKRFNILYLFTLLGSHTIGRSTFSSVMNKIYNFYGIR